MWQDSLGKQKNIRLRRSVMTSTSLTEGCGRLLGYLLIKIADTIYYVSLKIDVNGTRSGILGLRGVSRLDSIGFGRSARQLEMYLGRRSRSRYMRSQKGSVLPIQGRFSFVSEGEYEGKCFMPSVEQEKDLVDRLEGHGYQTLSAEVK